MNLLQQEYEELLRARAILREKWVREADINDIEYYCPVNLKRLIFKVKEEPSTHHIVSPITAIHMVQQLADSCVLSHFKLRYDSRMAKLNKTREEGKINTGAYLAEKEDITKEAGMQMFHLHLRLWLSSMKVCN